VDVTVDPTPSDIVTSTQSHDIDSSRECKSPSRNPGFSGAQPSQAKPKTIYNPVNKSGGGNTLFGGDMLLDTR
jgi:hypothetical protein